MVEPVASTTGAGIVAGASESEISSMCQPSAVAPVSLVSRKRTSTEGARCAARLTRPRCHDSPAEKPPKVANAVQSEPPLVDTSTYP